MPGDRGDFGGGVWPENVAAVAAFLAVSSQWRLAPRGDGAVVIGLDYAGAAAGLELAGLRVTPDLWAAIRVIEVAAVDEMNGRAQ